MAASQVLVAGWYGAGNLGDEMLLSLFVDGCRELGARAVALSFDPAGTTARHGIAAVDIADLAAVEAAMSASGLFALGGGGLLQTHDRFTLDDLDDFDAPGIGSYVRPLLMARQLGVPTLLWAQGLGPLEGGEPRAIVRDLFDWVDHACLRDAGSLALLRALGSQRDCRVAPDPAWAWPLPAVEPLPGAGPAPRRIAIVPRAWPSAPEWPLRLQQALQASEAGAGTHLVWLASQTASVPGRVASDIDFIRSLMASFEGRFSQELQVHSDAAGFTRALAGCQATIAMRLHAQLLSLRLGLPTFCLEYDAKMSATSAQAGVGEDARLDVSSPAGDWNTRLPAWLEATAGLARARGAAIDGLEREALAHREVLREAIAGAGRRPPAPRWPAPARDWLAAWHRRRLGRELEAVRLEAAMREARLSERLDACAEALADARDQAAALGENLHAREVELASLQASRSWRLTRPLRSLRRMARGREVVAVPASAPTPASAAPATTAGDLDWASFQAKVLSRRGDYRGVFVQECVIDWNVALFQRPQHIALAMARAGYLVIYRTGNFGGDDVQGFREVSPGVWLTNRPEVDGLGGVVRSIYSTGHSRTPESLAACPRDNVLVYEYVDHIDPRISGTPENVARLAALRDWAMGGGVDLVAATSRVLHAEACAALGPERCLFVPNGVDTRHYRDPAQASVVLPEALRDFRRRHARLVGYFGAIAPWLWYDALAELVALRPGLGFVFIGPDYFGGAARLPVAPNVLHLGAVDYRVLPAHGAVFDACMIPFEPGDIARSTSPLKLFEYFALEKPVVVSSQMIECTVFPEVFHGDSPATLAAALDQALAVAGDGGFRARLATLADQNDWDRRAARLDRAARRGAVRAGAL